MHTHTHTHTPTHDATSEICLDYFSGRLFSPRKIHCCKCQQTTNFPVKIPTFLLMNKNRIQIRIDRMYITITCRMCNKKMISRETLARGANALRVVRQAKQFHYSQRFPNNWPFCAFPTRRLSLPLSRSFSNRRA